MTKARDLANIISGGFTASDIPNLDASKITSGTFADARIAASNVSQHAQSFDDDKIINDISTLGLRVHTQENLNASNTNSASFDVFQDSSGITNLTNTQRNASEYVSSTVTQNANTSITLNSSNYATYLGESSVQQTKTGRTGNDRFNPELATNVSLSSQSDFIANTVPNASQEETLLSYYFGNSSTATQYVFDNTNTSQTYRVIAHNMRFKEGVTFSPTNGANYTFTWRNGAATLHSSQGIVLWGLDDGGTGDNDYTATGIGQMGTVSNGTTYNVAITNSSATFFDGITFRVFHTSGNSYMWNNLQIPGTVNAPTDVVSATGSFEGNAITASSSTNKMGAVITYQDNAGTNALNTDIILKLSADNGSNFSTATLTSLPDFATGIKMAKVNDLSVTAGTQLKYKIEFANQSAGSKEARIRGVSLQF